MHRPVWTASRAGEERGWRDSTELLFYLEMDPPPGEPLTCRCTRVSGEEAAGLSGEPGVVFGSVSSEIRGPEVRRPSGVFYWN